MESSSSIKPGRWLADRGEAVRAAWLDQAAAQCSDAYRDFVRAQRDPFANPGGAILRKGIDRLFAAIVEGGGADQWREILEPVIRLKAVQDAPPSQALAFLPLLKTIIRAHANEHGGDGAAGEAMAEFDARIDAMLLVAFDVYLECREAIYLLRVNEMKRNVARLLTGSGEPAGPEADPLRAGDAPPASVAGRNDS